MEVQYQSGKVPRNKNIRSKIEVLKAEAEYLEALRLAETIAKKNVVVTIGIKPDYPATRFGYIETTTNATYSLRPVPSTRIGTATPNVKSRTRRVA